MMITIDWIIAISTILYVLVTGFILCANQRSARIANKQLQLSLERLKPLLSMRLDEVQGFLFLSIENNGQTPAKDIVIKIDSIKNNGESELLETQLDQQFDLFPNEKVQRRVSIWGASMGNDIVFPTVSLDVSYVIAGTNECMKYSRNVVYSKYFDTRVYADVNINKRELETSIKAIKRATVRVANYLDGHQVTAFDEGNILAGKSLQNDLYTAINKGEKMPIHDRASIISGKTYKEQEQKSEKK